MMFDGRTKYLIDYLEVVRSALDNAKSTLDNRIEELKTKGEYLLPCDVVSEVEYVRSLITDLEPSVFILSRIEKHMKKYVSEWCCKETFWTRVVGWALKVMGCG